MKNSKNEMHFGGILAIPLFLPCFQEWRQGQEGIIDYKKYEFHKDDIYAFDGEFAIQQIRIGDC